MSQFQYKNKLRAPGEVRIESVILSSYNGFQLELKNNIIEIVIHESMDRSCLTGHVIVVDNMNLVRNVPIIGNEEITLSFYTPSRRMIDKTFFCYKIDPKADDPSNKALSTYKIHFVSKFFVDDRKKKISQSFKNKKYHEMVKTIFTENISTTKKFTIQETLEKRNLVIPYMSPFDAIDLISTMAISKNTNDESYLFFEDMDGFYFCCMNYISKYLQKAAIPTFKWFRVGLSSSDKRLEMMDIEKDMKRIEEYSYMSCNNTINNIKNGLFSSKNLIHDVTYKTLKHTDFSYNNDFYKLDLLNTYGILPEKGDEFSKQNFAHYRMYSQHSYQFTNVLKNEDFDRTILRRNARLAQLENARFSILVPGDSQIRMGTSVNVEIPSTQPTKPNEPIELDPYVSGKYMITELTHIVTTQEYKMRLHLERDSMPLAYPETKTVESKR